MLFRSVEEYNLTLYDKFEPEQIAPEGYLWIVQAGAYKSLNNARVLQNRLAKMGVISIVKQYREEESQI